MLTDLALIVLNNPIIPLSGAADKASHRGAVVCYKGMNLVESKMIQ